MCGSGQSCCLVDHLVVLQVFTVGEEVSRVLGVQGFRSAGLPLLNLGDLLGLSLVAISRPNGHFNLPHCKSDRTQVALKQLCLNGVCVLWYALFCRTAHETDRTT